MLPPENGEQRTVTCSQQKLPLELYRDIIQYVNRSYLSNLVAVSEAFGEEAERALYDVIGLERKPWRTPLNRSEWAALGRLSAKSPLLTHRLTSLDLWKYMWQGDCQYPLVHPSTALLAQVLQSTPNLIALRIHAVAPAFVSTALAVELPFKLQIFHYSGVTSRDKTFRRRLTAFLTNQPDLEELDIGGLSCNLPPNTLPQLKMLIGSQISCLAILPRPQLTHLKLVDYPRGKAETELSLNLVAGLKSLSIMDPYYIFFYCFQQVHTIELLEFVGNFPMNYLSGRDIHERFPGLETFRFVYFKADAPVAHRPMQNAPTLLIQVVEDLFQGCLTLLWVSVRCSPTASLAFTWSRDHLPAHRVEKWDVEAWKSNGTAH